MPAINVWAPAVALGWLIPGGGHFLLKRNGRAILLLISVTFMFLCGLMMRGAMFQPQSGDLLTMLINTGGFVGDLCSGILYLLSVWLGYNQADMRRRRARLRHQVPGHGRPAERAGHGRRLRNRSREERLMPKMNLSHFEAAFLFSLFTSIVLGVVTKRDDKDRLNYGLYVFGCFLAALFGIGWLMHFGHG